MNNGIQEQGFGSMPFQHNRLYDIMATVFRYVARMRSVFIENIYKRTLRFNDYDGVGQASRRGADVVKADRREPQIVRALFGTVDCPLA